MKIGKTLLCNKLPRHGVPQMNSRHTISLAIALILVSLSSARAQAGFEFGFGKSDITPSAPVRLSGYGNRTEVFEGVDEKLFVRAMAIRTGGQVSVLISVDTIGFPGTLTKSIAARVNERHQIPRDRIVVCGTHSHTAPHISDGLTNIFAAPLTEEQDQHSREYTLRVGDLVVSTVEQAITDLQPGKLFVAQGQAGFAQNRRALEDGIWKGFGVNQPGVTDHTLPALKVTDAAGSTRGILFNYACHCTTFGPSYNRVNGDWAGHASRMIESQYPGTTALCTIGCGADQNPARDNDAEKAKALSIAQGREIANEISRMFSGNMAEVTGELSTSFGYAGLPVDRPSVDELKEQLNDRRPQARRHAQNMLELRERMGRIPETYPAPVQVWRFGEQVCMVFLGGEVVVDYALRLKREIKSKLVWVSAYSNDVFGYVASERVRKEGGYEVSGSMIYYNQPGPWGQGTEEVLVRRVHELVEQGNFAGPFTAEEAVKRFHMRPGYEIGIVAAEPLIADPVNFAVAADGRLWVVEMGDYPRGVDDQGKPGGRVRVLDDVDGDGRYDKSTLFLDGLEYPNGVFPWRDGVLISGAPTIIYAEDTDGDDRADVKKPLFRGFEADNPQHRVAGFAYGLDNWLYLASGTNNHEIESVATGKTVDMSGRDLRVEPDRGLIETVSGRTQFGRNRDDWGNWFGGDNSHPIWHYVMSDRYLSRNPYFPAPDPLVHLMTPSLAPPIYPTSRTLDRFNDLFALNRFTSACSQTIFRDISLGPDVQGAAFVSEPVHNLVHRAMLVPDGVSFAATRHPDEQESEFLSSTDHWFRPTTTSTGPDGALWVVDMYRQVIEHPEWIPESWQAQLDLRAGDKRGRIYRVFRSSEGTQPIPALADLSVRQLVEELSHPNGWRRDTAQQLLVQRRDTAVVPLLRDVLRSGSSLAKVHALGTLQGLDSLSEDDLLTTMDDKDARVQRRAILLSEPMLNEHAKLGQRIVELGTHPDERVRMQVALTLGEWSQEAAAGALAKMAVANVNDAWARTAVLSSSVRHANQMLSQILGDVGGSPEHSLLLQHLISTAIRASGDNGVAQVLQTLTASSEGTPRLWEIEALASFDRAIRQQKMSLAALSEEKTGSETSLRRAVQIVAAARKLAEDDTATVEQRVVALQLLGRGFDKQVADRRILAEFLSPTQAVALQLAAVHALSQMSEQEIPNLLLANWRQLSPQVQSEVLGVLLAKRPWQEQLLAAIESQRVAASDLDATTRNRLVSIGNRAFRDRARKQLGDSINSDRQAVINAYESAARTPGNAKRGAESFKKTCAACHRHNNVGTDIGASLASLKDKSDESLLISVLDPNRAIEGKYKNYTCLTTDGRVLSGMIVAESTSNITLAQANGTKLTLLRVDIDELSNTGLSFMPEGLEKDFTPQELADIFAYVRGTSGVE
jgi:putative membrane-bound dehydrogenase-like protein